MLYISFYLRGFLLITPTGWDMNNTVRSAVSRPNGSNIVHCAVWWLWVATKCVPIGPRQYNNINRPLIYRIESIRSEWGSNWFLCSQFLRSVGVAVFALMRTGVILPDVLAHHAAAGRSLPLVGHLYQVQSSSIVSLLLHNKWLIETATIIYR